MPILESEAIWKQGDFLHLDSDKVQADNDVVYATKYTHICLVCNLIHLEIHLEMAIHSARSHLQTAQKEQQCISLGRDTCSLRLTPFSCLRVSLVAVWPRYGAI